MISVVMATYNRAHTLPRAIDSVLRQSHEDWELLIVDDGSTDATPKVLEDLVDPRIRIYRHPQNRGVTAAKNTGLDHVMGEWFTTLDSDDEVTADALEAMLACAEHTGATAITCNCVDSATGQMSGSGPTADGWLTPEQTAGCRGEFWGLTRTSLLGDLRFDEHLPGFESTVWLKINRRARRYYLHRALRIYHTEGADRVTRANRSASLRRTVDVFYRLGGDAVYLRELRKVNLGDYKHTMTRVWAARVLHPLLGLLPASPRAKSSSAMQQR
jgi:glycosyltransferase involved in cell wall biosynthesis